MTDVATTPRKPMSTMRRLRIYESTGGHCVLCGQMIYGYREKWIVEHKIALGLGGEDTDENCGPAHEICRREKDKDDVKAIAKAKRVKAKHIGARRASRPMPGAKASGWRHRIDGTWERR